MVQDTIRQAEEKMKKTLEAFRRDLAGMKVGRATPALLDRISVDYFGTHTHISQMANIQVPEPRMLVIQPWDKSTIKAIEKAILASDLGINPSNDGTVIRLAIPALTEERRRDVVKVLHKRAEEERVILRNLRRDANDSIKATEKQKQVSEDESRRAQEQVQKTTDKYMKELDQILATKEREVMEV